ncbi:polyubiquitin-like [Gouania willdenowi]|uniref:polyubiquitin-like n=1 Tax=Gouania willdenowi TaxID=441366 RepID=UPI001054BB22|nr:polyubiquitin-like [Gouania willdenowi]XP_028313425.1 polyubiquitin-like [Gouania willdenowi]
MGMDIVVKMLDGTTHTLRMKPEDTVGALKDRIQSQMGVHRQSQSLTVYGEQRIVLTDDRRRLCDYGLQSGTQVALLVTQPAPVQVFLRTEKGQTKTYEIKAGESVEEFKTQVQKKEGVAKDQQRLIHEGKEMVVGKLEDYGVQEMSTIYLTLRLRGGSSHY